MCVGPFLWKAYGTIFTLIVKYFLCTDCTNVVCVSELVHILIWHPPLSSTFETILNFCNEWQMTISNNGISSNFLAWTERQVNIDSYNNVAFFQNEWATRLSCSHIFGVKKPFALQRRVDAPGIIAGHAHTWNAFCTPLEERPLERVLF